jgi:hypothetical protein
LNSKSGYYNTGTHCLISGKNNHSNSGTHCSISGYYNSSNSGSYCVIGGTSNTSNSGDYCLITGAWLGGNSGDYCLIAGSTLSNSGNYSVLSGHQASNDLHGARVHASGQFAAKGDAQNRELVARAATTTTTPGVITLDGSSDAITLPANTSWAFDGRVIARNIDTVGENKAFWIKGAISRDGNAASTALIGSVEIDEKSTGGGSDASWSIAVTADTTGGALKIEVTGELTTNIRWVATLDLTEVSG